jgi:metal-responsive CopG/Arc/MetJ family transcriptional regulator
METIQVVIDETLLKAADWAAHQYKLNRSALIRDALRQHLKRLRVREAEELDRRGYGDQPQQAGNLPDWEREAAWPEE